MKEPNHYPLSALGPVTPAFHVLLDRLMDGLSITPRRHHVDAFFLGHLDRLILGLKGARRLALHEGPGDVGVIKSIPRPWEDVHDQGLVRPNRPRTRVV